MLSAVGCGAMSLTNVSIVSGSTFATSRAKPFASNKPSRKAPSARSYPHLLRSADLSAPIYAVHLTFTKGIHVSVHLKAIGSGNAEEASAAQETTETWNEDSFPAGSEGLAQRVTQAFNRAVKLCGAKEETF